MKSFQKPCLETKAWNFVSANRGVALVVVLVILVLLSGLLTAFFMSVSTERTGAKTSANSSDARKLADTALSIVVAQIKDATIGSGTTTWASQPGVIRTYDVSGAPSDAYKLYSASSLRGGALFNPTSNDVVPDDWYNTPALYTDLNSPVYVPDANGSITIDGQSYSSNYPIIDPAVLDSTNKPKGFDVQSAPVAKDSTNANRVPMPVQWLYVLQNGEIVPATAGRDGNTVNLTGSGASAKNPIVGRIAFWTDDETCKVNINTAAGDLWSDTTNFGSYCDLPVANNPNEAGDTNSLQKCQPVQHEYQRYPGHPATTYLSAVFPQVFSNRQSIYDVIPRVTYYKSGDSSKQDISSQGGTFNTVKSSSVSLPLSDGDHLYASVDELQFVTTQSSLTGTSRPANLFTPDQVKQAKFFLTAQSRAPDVNLFGKPRVGIWPEIADASGNLTGTPFDKTIAFCSTIGSSPNSKAYYFVRNDPTSTTYDYTNYPRNQALYQYLQNLTSQAIPGFGGNFWTKYTDTTSSVSDRDQILTEIFDYIRGCVNLVDQTPTSSGKNNPYAGSAGNSYTSQARANPPGTGSVVPIHIVTSSGTTSGFGRNQTLYSPTLLLTALDSVVANGTTGVVLSGTYTNGLKDYKLLTKKVQAVFLMNSFSPAEGVVRTIPNLVYQVEGLDKLSIASAPMGFPQKGAVEFNSYTPDWDMASGGMCGAGSLFFNQRVERTLGVSVLGASGVSSSSSYPFFSSVIDLPDSSIQVPKSGSYVAISGTYGAEYKSPLTLSSTGNIKLTIFAKDKNGKVDANNPIQTIELSFPTTSIPTPLANIIPAPFANSTGTGSSYTPQVASGTASMMSRSAIQFYRKPNSCMTNNNVNGYSIYYDSTRGLAAMGSKVRGDLRLVAARPYVDSSFFIPADGYFAQSTLRPANTGTTWAYDYDYASKGGLYPALNNRPDSMTDGMMAGADRNGKYGGVGWAGFSGGLAPGVTYGIHPNKSNSVLGTAAYYPDSTRMTLPNGNPMPNYAVLLGSDGSSYVPGDWDTSMSAGLDVDGPYINKADEGEGGTNGYIGYDATMGIGTLFSPNRQVPSPAIFGSLSTGVMRMLPWQTLLFCPNPPAGDLHPGFGKPASGSAGPTALPPFTTPPDHLLLDLFTMPVVEPYAISEPFSTAGKINLNYQIVPFTYIKRSTGLQAVLRSTRVVGIPTGDGLKYKDVTATPPSANANSVPYRMNVDIDTTLGAFDDRFQNNHPFRSPSEICQMYLVPASPFPGSTPNITGTTAAAIASSMNQWWDDYRLTGDNLRERPYAQIYSRLTTKSNSYTVHVRVQALKKRTSDPNQNQWVEGKDHVVGEYRGAFSIERFIDPNDSSLSAFDENYFGSPSYDSSGNITRSGQLDPFYRFRIVSTKQFIP